MNILISGGSGLVGTRLSKMLVDKGHSVKILSRKKKDESDYVLWDIKNNYLAEDALDNIDAIIHLAGEGIADARWTDNRKIAILESRVDSTVLLYNALKIRKHNVKTFISASAVGYYSNRGNEMMYEDALPAKDFLGTTCVFWEQEVKKISELGIRTVNLRTGIVLSLDGGALKKMVMPFYFGFGSALGNGKQWMSWIHIADLCEMFIYALEKSSMKGAYNAVAPEPARNDDFSRTLARVLNKGYWAPKVPAFILKLIFGEMAIVVLGSTKASADKITKTGFRFQFENLADALKNLFNK